MIKLNKEEKKSYKYLKELRIKSNDYFYDFGYNFFGKFVLGYVMWIKEQLESSGISKVFFLSRDGYIMKKVFDIIKGDDIASYYLEVSRRSLRIPTFYLYNDYEDLVHALPDAKLISIKMFFETIGLNIENYIDKLEKYGISLDSSFDKKDIEQVDSLRQLYINELHRDVVSNSKDEYSILTQYLKQNEVEGRFAIVDIGWSGSMQRFLISTLNSLKIENSIKGLYIGVADYYINNFKIDNSMDLNGYLFDFKNGDNPIDYRKPFVGLFETLFLEQDGSVERYIANGEKIVSKRMPYEYRKEGKLTIEAINVGKIQNGAIDFVKKNYNSRDTISKISPFCLFYDLYRIGMNPSIKEAKIFGDFSFEDNGVLSYLAKKNKNNSFKRDFLESRWKIGYLKRIFLIALPYDKIFDFLYKFK